MTIDSVEAAGDSTDIFENWEDRYENVIWNGREITILDQQHTDQFIAKAQAIIQSLNAEKKHQALVRHVKQLDSLEERAFDFAPVEHEFILINSQLSESEIIQCGLFKRVWDGMRKGAKKAAKAFKKVIDAVKKAAEEFAHGTKKAAEKVADFVKDHKKETLIAAAIIAAIAGAFIISGALSGGAATTGGGTPTRRKEDEKDDKTSPPSDPPPLPDWVSDLLKSTTPDFSPDKLTEASLENAKKEAHNAWNLFNNLKSDTENGLAALKKFEPEFNPSSHAVNTILNTLLQDPQKYEFSKNLISSQNWTDIIQSGHEKIDQAFITLLSGIQTSIPPPPPPPKPSPTFLDKIRLGLEIIGRGMMEPELLDPNSPIDPFFKDEQKEFENISKGQSIGDFFETIRNTLQNESETIRNEMNNLKLYDPNLSLNLPNTQDSSEQRAGFNTLSFFRNTITPVLKTLGGLAFIHEPLSSLAELSKPQISRYFETEGVKRDHMLITCTYGMYNSFEDGIANLNYTKKLSNSDLCIEGVYNHTNGPLADPAEAFLFNYFDSPITQDLLAKKWIEFHERNKNNPNAKVLHFCHSQGAIHTKNTLMKLPKEIRERIIVIAIAPATIVPDELCYQSFNYASKNDIVHLGEDLIMQITINSFFDNESIQREQSEIFQKHKAKLILLEPREGADDFDHDFISPTYEPEIKLHFKNYLDQQGVFK